MTSPSVRMTCHPQRRRGRAYVTHFCTRNYGLRKISPRQGRLSLTAANKAVDCGPLLNTSTCKRPLMLYTHRARMRNYRQLSVYVLRTPDDDGGRGQVLSKSTDDCRLVITLDRRPYSAIVECAFTRSFKRSSQLCNQLHTYTEIRTLFLM